MAYVNKRTIQTQNKTMIKTITKAAVERKHTGSVTEVSYIGKFIIGQDLYWQRGKLPSEILLMPCSKPR